MNENLNQKASAAFTRFSPFIRDYIYKNGWNELRCVQIEAAHEIFNTEANVLISSETASGKTEAALFPILSLMDRESAEEMSVLYISPLKSLINDQYSRMELLLEESGLPVFRWHGDVSQHQKKAFLNHPCGLLQITPESLESMLIHRSNDIPRLFGNLKFVILDEIHALMGSDRGAQILCQLQRISKMISYSPRRIGLSATIGDPEGAAAWLGMGSGRDTKSIQIKADSISWRLGLEHFQTTEKTESGHNPADAFIYKATKNEKCVVFSNSREETEQITANLRRMAKKLGEEDRFYIHHGNLSATIREETEAILKDDEKPVTACATVTLELGIDIGRLRRIINQGAPGSVSGFLQRIGRSGRREEKPEMLMVFREEEPLPGEGLDRLVPWELLQAIAIIELYRTERWIEPAGQKKLPASLLFHQTLSILASKGALSAAKLAKEVLSLAPFASFEKEAFKELLLSLLSQNYIELTDEKELILGLRGERMLSSFKFYAVFKDSEDFTVRCGSEEIGTITSTPPIGERFALAGKVWEVEEVDVSKKLIFAKAIDGVMKVSWPGAGGAVHTKILQKMREVLLSSEEYPYLMPAAKKRLAQARALAKSTGFAKKSILPLGANRYIFFPWLGTKAFQTIKRIFQKKLAPALSLCDIQSAGCYFITFRCETSDAKNIKDALCDLLEEDFSAQSLITKTEYPVIDKYDACLPHSLLLRSYAENNLNLEEVKERIKNLKAE